MEIHTDPDVLDDDITSANNSQSFSLSIAKFSGQTTRGKTTSCLQAGIIALSKQSLVAADRKRVCRRFIISNARRRSVSRTP